jgi:hypothetical protein
VARLKDQPFALVGVNSDTDMDKLKARLAEEKVTWPSFRDGDTDGPIARKWNVSSWPTIFVIDKKGIVRARGVGGAELDRWVEKLLGEPAPAPSPAR